MQGVDVNMCDGVETLHPVSACDRVDGLPFLDDVHVVLASMHHLLLVAHLDRCRAGLLRPGGNSSQQQCQYQKYLSHAYSHSMVAGGLELMS